MSINPFQTDFIFLIRVFLTNTLIIIITFVQLNNCKKVRANINTFSLLVALMIHVSPKTKEILDTFETFELVCRGEVTLKVRLSTNLRKWETRVEKHQEITIRLSIFRVKARWPRTGWSAKNQWTIFNSQAFPYPRRQQQWQPWQRSRRQVLRSQQRSTLRTKILQACRRVDLIR